MLVAVGSTNPTKINAVKTAFKKVWPDKPLKFKGLEVNSGVSEQPMSDKECIRGATNRARQARDATKADFGVGLEGGLQEIEGKHFDCGWIVIIDKNDTLGVGSTIKVVVPKSILKTLKNQKDLGAALNVFFGLKDVPKTMGHFGIMTNNTITRTTGYSDGVVAALARFLHPEVFEEKE